MVVTEQKRVILHLEYSRLKSRAYGTGIEDLTSDRVQSGVTYGTCPTTT